VWPARRPDTASNVKRAIREMLHRTGVLASGIRLCPGSATVSVDTADLVNKPAAELADLNLVQLMQIEVPTVVTASKHEQKVTKACRVSSHASGFFEGEGVTVAPPDVPARHPLPSGYACKKTLAGWFCRAHCTAP